jgi:hypothetical protein
MQGEKTTCLLQLQKSLLLLLLQIAIPDRLQEVAQSKQARYLRSHTKSIK